MIAVGRSDLYNFIFFTTWISFLFSRVEKESSGSFTTSNSAVFLATALASPSAAAGTTRTSPTATPASPSPTCSRPDPPRENYSKAKKTISTPTKVVKLKAWNLPENKKRTRHYHKKGEGNWFRSERKFRERNVLFRKLKKKDHLSWELKAFLPAPA